MHVPFTNYIIKYLKTIDSKKLLRGVNELRIVLINRKLYNFGILKDIKRVISKRAVCKIKNSNVILY